MCVCVYEGGWVILSPNAKCGREEVSKNFNISSCLRIQNFEFISNSGLKCFNNKLILNKIMCVEIGFKGLFVVQYMAITNTGIHTKGVRCDWNGTWRGLVAPWKLRPLFCNYIKKQGSQTQTNMRAIQKMFWGPQIEIKIASWVAVFTGFLSRSHIFVNGLFSSFKSLQ